MNVIFLSPAYPPEMQQFTRGLARVGVRVLGVGDAHPQSMPVETRHALDDYLQVPALFDEGDTAARVTQWLAGRKIDNVLSNWEPLVLLAARLRMQFGIPGMSVDTVRGFRDKQLMKERVSAAGLRVAKSARASTQAEIRTCAEQLGFPMVVKPIAGAGSADTFRVGSADELEATLKATAHVVEVSCEEFIEGDEYTYDTVCVAGKPVYESVARYLPNALIMRSNEWVSPIVATVRNLTQPHVRKGIELGRKVLSALKMGDGFTHMEWFHTKSGEVVFGEIACRPAGAYLVDQMNYTSDIDLFVEWARAVCWKEVNLDSSRKYNTAMVFKRAEGQGRISNITGLHDFLRKYGEFVVDEKLLRPGQSRRNWRNTLLSDGHILVRHPDWDTTVMVANAAATDVKLYAKA